MLSLVTRPIVTYVGLFYFRAYIKKRREMWTLFRMFWVSNGKDLYALRN